MDNSYHDSKPHINAKGDIVWSGYDGLDTEIFMTVVPEPISSTLFIVGGATLGFRQCRKRRLS